MLKDCVKLDTTALTYSGKTVLGGREFETATSEFLASEALCHRHSNIHRNLPPRGQGVQTQPHSMQVSKHHVEDLIPSQDPSEGILIPSRSFLLPLNIITKSKTKTSTLDSRT